MTRLNLNEATTEEIQRRLNFAEKLIQSLVNHNRPGTLDDIHFTGTILWEGDMAIRFKI